MFTSPIITGTSIKGPTTAVNAYPESMLKTATDCNCHFEIITCCGKRKGCCLSVVYTKLHKDKEGDT